MCRRRGHKTRRHAREDGDQEFVTLAAMLLCGDLDLRADTFQQITAKPEVRIAYEDDIVLASNWGKKGYGMLNHSAC